MYNFTKNKTRKNLNRTVVTMRSTESRTMKDLLKVFYVGFSYKRQV